jgi:hypothetical protein
MDNDIFDALDNQKEEFNKKWGFQYRFEKDMPCSIVFNGDFSTKIISWGGEREPMLYS